MRPICSVRSVCQAGVDVYIEGLGAGVEHIIVREWMREKDWRLVIMYHEEGSRQASLKISENPALRFLA